MNRTYLTLVALIAVVAIGAVTYAAYDYNRPREVSSATTAPEVPDQAVRAYGEVTLSLGETAVFPDVRVTPLAVLEDSRCPTDVTCIQAGTVRVRVEIVSAMGTSTNDMRLGTQVTTEAEEVRFMDALPERRSGSDIGSPDYRFSFSVTKRVATEPAPPPGKCYVGGCSMQLCTDRPDMASTCEYRESYACYQGATCERQASGECGWTQTPGLAACLENAR